MIPNAIARKSQVRNFVVVKVNDSLWKKVLTLKTFTNVSSRIFGPIEALLQRVKNLISEEIS